MSDNYSQVLHEVISLRVQQSLVRAHMRGKMSVYQSLVDILIKLHCSISNVTNNYDTITVSPQSKDMVVSDALKIWNIPDDDELAVNKLDGVENMVIALFIEYVNLSKVNVWITGGVITFPPLVVPSTSIEHLLLIIKKTKNCTSLISQYVTDGKISLSVGRDVLNYVIQIWRRLLEKDFPTYFSQFGAFNNTTRNSIEWTHGGDLELFIKDQIHFTNDESPYPDDLIVKLEGLLDLLDYYTNSTTPLDVLKDVFRRVPNTNQVPTHEPEPSTSEPNTSDPNTSEHMDQVPLPEPEPTRRTGWIVTVSVLSIISVALVILLILNYNTKCKKK